MASTCRYFYVFRVRLYFPHFGLVKGALLLSPTNLKSKYLGLLRVEATLRPNHSWEGTTPLKPTDAIVRHFDNSQHSFLTFLS